MEEWKEYTDIPNIWVSNMGKVKITCPVKKKDIHLKPKHYGKYYRIQIQKKNENLFINIHTLVAQVFIPNTVNGTRVIHKNKNYHDNRVENLEWYKQTGRPRKNSQGITISTGTLDLSDRYSSVSTHDEPVVIGDYRIEYIKSISKWSVFRIIDDNTIEYKGIHDSKDEAEMAVPDEVYQNEPY